MLSELIPDEIPDHHTSQDDRSMRVIAMNAMFDLGPVILPECTQTTFESTQYYPRKP